MKTFLSICMLLCTAWVALAQEIPLNMTQRVYQVDATRLLLLSRSSVKDAEGDGEATEALDPFDPFAGGEGSPEAQSEVNSGKLLREALQRFYDLEFPQGSHLEYEPMMGSLVMIHTREGHAALVTLMEEVRLRPQSLSLQLRLVAFPEKKLQALERKLKRPLRPEELLEQWKQGLGESLFISQQESLVGAKSSISRTGSEKGKETELSFDIQAPPYSRWFSLTLHQQLQLPARKDLNLDAQHLEIQTQLTLVPGEPKLVATSSSADGSHRFVYFARIDTRSVGRLPEE